MVRANPDGIPDVASSNLPQKNIMRANPDSIPDVASSSLRQKVRANRTDGILNTHSRTHYARFFRMANCCSPSSGGTVTWPSPHCTRSRLRGSSSSPDPLSMRTPSRLPARRAGSVAMRRSTRVDNHVNSAEASGRRRGAARAARRARQCRCDAVTTTALFLRACTL